MNSERAIALKQHRNAILSCLRACWPGTLPGKELYRIMIDRWPDYERLFCSKDLAYLEGKGYAERKHPVTRKVTTDPELKWHEADWHLTIRGTEVADQVYDDPALEV